MEWAEYQSREGYGHTKGLHKTHYSGGGVIIREGGAQIVDYIVPASQ